MDRREFLPAAYRATTQNALEKQGSYGAVKLQRSRANALMANGPQSHNADDRRGRKVEEQ